jgi:hypothetical protein
LNIKGLSSGEQQCSDHPESILADWLIFPHNFYPLPMTLINTSGELPYLREIQGKSIYHL